MSYEDYAAARMIDTAAEAFDTVPAVASLKRIWEAGRVRRWHANPDLSWTEDYNDAHQGRCARLLLALHPMPDAILIAAALTHDDGELATGDWPFEFKRDWPDLREQGRMVENISIRETWAASLPFDRLSKENKAWIKFVDRLDGYIWTKHRAPHLLMREDWITFGRSLKEFAKANSIWEQVREVM